MAVQTSVTMTPDRLRNRGPDYLRHHVNSTNNNNIFAHRRKSAVELLEASKSEYVKSRSVLKTKQELKHPENLHIGNTPKSGTSRLGRSKSEFSLASDNSDRNGNFSFIVGGTPVSASSRSTEAQKSKPRPPELPPKPSKSVVLKITERLNQVVLGADTCDSAQINTSENDRRRSISANSASSNCVSDKSDLSNSNCLKNRTKNKVMDSKLRDGDSEQKSSRPREPDLPSRPREPDVPSRPREPDLPSRPREPDLPSRLREPDLPPRPKEPDPLSRPREPDLPPRLREPDRPSRPREPDRPSRPREPDRPSRPKDCLLPSTYQSLSTSVTVLVEKRCSGTTTAHTPSDIAVMRRKKNTLHRSQSDLSCRHSRTSSDFSDLSSRLSRTSTELERFFNEMGIDRSVLDPMLKLHKIHKKESDLFESLSSLELGSEDRSSVSGVSQSGKSQTDKDKKEEVRERNSSQGTQVEKNARIIKWLCNVKKARFPPPQQAS